MKVVLTGATGQLGLTLQQSVPAGVDLVALSRATCDLASPASLPAVIELHRPEVVINAGAYTQVDKAETERELAFRINAEASRSLANTVAATGGRLIQISTDFVFDGSQGTPYSPDAPTHPLNAYGASKLAGESAVLEELGDRATVIRTAWVYSRHGGNFVKTMLRLMSSRDVVQVVCDQVGSPTATHSLAEAIWRVVQTGAGGVFHWTDAGVASWYDFAVAIEEEAHVRGLTPKRVAVVPIAAMDYAAQFPATVRRPAFSVLDTRSSKETLALQPTHWRIRLREVLDELP